MRLRDQSCIVIPVVLVFLMNSCRRDKLDYQKFSSPNPLIGIPLGNSVVKASDLIQEDDFFKYDTSGLIRLWVNDDSTYRENFYQSLNDITLDKLTNRFSFSDFVLPVVDDKQSITLRDLAKNLNDQEKQDIESLDGKLEIFPSVILYDNERTRLFDSVDFKYLNFSEGNLTIEIKNNLPTSVSNIIIDLFDTTQTGQEVLIGSFQYPIIQPLSSRKESVSLKGKRISDRLCYTIKNAETVQSAFPVIIDLNSDLGLNINLINGKVISGFAKLPEVNLFNQFNRIDLSDNLGSYKLKNIGVYTGKLDISMKTSLKTNVNLELALPDITLNGQYLDKIILKNKSGENTSRVNLSDSRIFLGSEVSKPFNQLRVVNSIFAESTSNMVEFDTSDAIELTFDFIDFALDYIQGDFGRSVENLNLGNIYLGDISDFSRGFEFDDPEIAVFVENSVGIPIEMIMDVTAKNNGGGELRLDVDTFRINTPSLMDRGQVKETVITIDKANSNIVDCISLPADRFDSKVRLTTNPDGTSFDNFIDRKSYVQVGYGVDIPMSFSAERVKLTDTVSFNAANLAGIERIQYADIELVTKNTFPFDVNFGLEFAYRGDSTLIIIDSLEDVDLVIGAVVNKFGIASDTVTKYSQIPISADLLGHFQRGAINCVIIKGMMNSTDITNNTVVSLNQNAELKTSLAIKSRVR